MKLSRSLIGKLSLLSVLLLGACSTEEANQPDTSQTTTEESSSEHEGHENMVHDESGEIPEGLEESDNPTYSSRSQVVIQNAHMPGMEGANGTVEGAFDTVAYEVTYDDTETGETVANHKWVVHEEIENPQSEPYQPGDEVELAAYHMPGMQGATATIDSAEDTTVYMVTYTDTETGDTVENHKWLTEEELAPSE